MQYASFFAVWLLSSLILGVVHGPAMGIFLGLGIATGYLLARLAPALVARWRSTALSDPRREPTLTRLRWFS